MKLANLLIGIAALLAALAGVWVQQTHSDSAFSQATTATLDFSLPDLNGQMHSISQWRGKLVVLNFWATWCPSCLKEIPEFIRLQQELGPQGLQIIGVSTDDPQTLQSFLKTYEINYPMLVAGDNGMVLSQQLGNIIGVLPFTVLIDRQGQVADRHIGELPGEKIRTWFAQFGNPAPVGEKSPISP